MDKVNNFWLSVCEPRPFNVPKQRRVDLTAQLISAFNFAKKNMQVVLYFLNPTFQASSHILWLYSPVCIGPGRKLPR